MTLSKSEIIDSIERLDEIATTLKEIRHRLIQELLEVEEEK